MMNRILVMSILGFVLYSCGRTSDSKLNSLEKGAKRTLKLFSEADVAKNAVAIFTKKSVQDFMLRKNGPEFFLTSQNGSDSGQQYTVKIGGHGLILYKDKSGNWTDKFNDRRIFYYEENDKLILSEAFEGDSTTYFEFVKK